MMMNLSAWPDFYDPDFYENEIGPGLRVGAAYAGLLGGSGGGSVVELGCGPGAIVIELAEHGHRVLGIDRSPGMLARARQKAAALGPQMQGRIRFAEGRLEDFTLDEPADAVLLTNELVLHLTEADTLVKAFRCCRRGLGPHGRVILDLPKIDWPALAAAIGTGGDTVYCRGYFPAAAAGSTIRVLEQVRFDPETWRLSKMFCYEHIDGNGRLTDKTYRHLVQRPWTVDEVRLALTAAGFGSVAQQTVAPLTDRTFVIASLAGDRP